MKQLTAALISAAASDLWPSLATVVDFGLDTSSHFGALQYEIRHGRVTPEELDAACGDGPELTRLVRRHGDNPYRHVTFTTSWDDIGEEEDFEVEFSEDDVRNVERIAEESA